MNQDALPTVLIPSLGGSARLFQAQLPALWTAGPVMVADHRRQDSIALIAAYILERAPAYFDLAGLSMGGYLAFEILRQAPDRVGRLALIDTSAALDSESARGDREKQLEIALSGDFESIARDQFQHVVHPAHIDAPSLKETFLKMHLETGPQAFVRQQTACLTRRDCVGMLPTIRCPTVVVVGDADSITPVSEAEVMSNGIPRARLAVVPDCGHLSTIDQPEHLTQILMAWKSTPL